MSELRASFYDIFGYLIPGVVMLGALRLFAWVLLYPSSILSFELFEKPFWIMLLTLIAYTLGHLTHAAGNWFNVTKSTDYERTSNNKKIKYWRVKMFNRPKVPDSVVDLADSELEKYFGQEIQKLSYSDRMTLIDEFRVIGSKENEREVYIYREGFYRGMIVSMTFLLMAIIASLFVGNLTFTYIKLQIVLRRDERMFCLIFIIISILGFWMRMTRFSYYRINRAVAYFLIISKNKKI